MIKERDFIMKKIINKGRCGYNQSFDCCSCPLKEGHCSTDTIYRKAVVWMKEHHPATLLEYLI